MFTTSAFIGIRTNGGTPTLVVPDAHNIVDSVTSDSARQVALSFGWKVEERSVRAKPLHHLAVTFALTVKSDQI
jgi:branched-subunit amino acid aminotransferase/4-amino-4-deoxychorismate lyase